MNDKFYDAWWYLAECPIFQQPGIDDGEWCLQQALDIHVTKVNPYTDSVDDDPAKNTEIQIWLEAGPWSEEYGYSHDYHLDCGGATLEEAIIELAERVKYLYRWEDKE